MSRILAYALKPDYPTPAEPGPVEGSYYYYYCSKCGHAKTSADFYHNRARPDGLDNYCRDCKDDAQRTVRSRKVEQRLSAIAARGKSAPRPRRAPKVSAAEWEDPYLTDADRAFLDQRAPRS